MKLPMKKVVEKGAQAKDNRRAGNASAYGTQKPRSDKGFKKGTHEDAHHDKIVRENARVSKGMAQGRVKSMGMKNVKVANTTLPYQKAMQQKEMSSDNIKVAKAMSGARNYLNGKQ